MRKKIDDQEEDDPASIPTITAGLQHLWEIWKVLSSVEHAEEMLDYVNKTENFLVETRCRNLEWTEIDTFVNIYFKK